MIFFVIDAKAKWKKINFNGFPVFSEELIDIFNIL